MKAMIFAAGLGTRLHPVTEQIPKALVEVGGKPLLRLVIEKLAAAGIRECVVNVHHFPGMIRRYLKEHPYPGMTIHLSDESGELLDTGGGLMHAARWLEGEEPVLVHNVDVISDLDIGALAEYHRERGGVATLAVRDRETRRYLLFNDEMRLRGWMDRQTGEIRRPEPADSPQKPEADIPLAFSGIHMVDPVVFRLITRRGRFSLIDGYLELAARYPIFGYPDRSPRWIDVGKPDQLRQAREQSGDQPR